MSLIISIIALSASVVTTIIVVLKYRLRKPNILMGINVAGQPQTELTRKITDEFGDRIHFSVQNQSSFSIKEPWITVLVPSSCRHHVREKLPDHTEKTKVDDQGKPIETYNTPLHAEVSQIHLEVEPDRDLIAGRLAPILGGKQKLGFWIRLALRKSNHPYTIQIGLHSESTESRYTDVRVVTESGE
jgi:hypothetical protein